MIHNNRTTIINCQKIVDVGFKVWGEVPSQDISTTYKPTEFFSSYQGTQKRFKSFVTYPEIFRQDKQVPQLQQTADLQRTTVKPLVMT